MYPRIALLLGLGGGQGLVGWWMVRSGLQGGSVDEMKRLQREIRVSPYRLATHLSVAFITYTTLIWTALSILNPAPMQSAVARTLSSGALQYARRLRGMAGLTGALVATTVLSGAFVAGNDAGNAYNSFPLMNDRWVPPAEELWEVAPAWRNFFESTAMVQFDHRVLAMTTLAAVASTLGFARFGAAGSHWKVLPGYCRIAAYSVGAMAVAQVTLGITTLLLYVPVPLAAAHQAGSLVLLTLVTGFAHSLSFSKYAPASAKASVSSSIPSGGAALGRATGMWGGTITGPAMGAMSPAAASMHTMSKQSHTRAYSSKAFERSNQAMRKAIASYSPVK
jgi:cytochrome c oxidase assembly protein subunit 15